MNIPREIIESENLASELSDYLNEFGYLIHLDDYCRSGGSIGGVEITDVKLKPYDSSDAFIEGTFRIEFHESYHNGCKDLYWKTCFAGLGSFSIDVETEEMKVGTKAKEVRHDLTDDDERMEKFIDEFTDQAPEEKKDHGA